MSKTQQEKQQIFREKLQAEGADAFANGPRPWEQWDESGNQGNDRIWEGSARRIYPKQAKRSIGDRLLSGLAVVALATLMVGIAGVYLSTTSTPQLASFAIHPAPIITDRQTGIDEDIATDATASLASLETLLPPAAGKSATPGPEMIILEPALQPAPTAYTAHIDRVAVETVITEAAVTTTVYTQQPSQDEPQLVATIETTPPPFTSRETVEKQQAVTASSQQNATIEPVEEPAGPAMIARAEVVATELAAKDPVAIQMTTPAAHEQTTPAVQTEATAGQTEPPLDKAEVAEEPVTIAINSSTAAKDPVAIQATTPVTYEQPTPAIQTEATAGQTEPPLDKAEVAEEPVTIAINSSTAAKDPVAIQATTPVTYEQATPAIQTEATAEQTEPPLDKAEVAETPATIAINSSTAAIEATADIASEIETTTETPVLPDAKTGKWVINISSYTRKSTAERMLAVFRQKGIEGEVFTTMINDKPMHRIRVAGFQSSRTAKAGIPAIEQALGVDDAWVSRR
ncbi:SPOR domain-containing protein [Gammaproteobacteria bacterium]|nr:SPOR domain-containing protein [Gammaproteobacteria bacterium]